jgi:transposase InsO family protein
VVEKDYFSQWIETEPLTTITSARVQAFTFKTIICRFGIPAEIVTDNGTHFTDKHFRELVEGLRLGIISPAFEHPQTNG